MNFDQFLRCFCSFFFYKNLIKVINLCEKLHFEGFTPVNFRSNRDEDPEKRQKLDPKVSVLMKIIQKKV